MLIAAYHVLLRLSEPRHPPYTLTYFLCYSYNKYFEFFLPACQRTLSIDD
jgi:hypothetical protein